MSGTGTLTVMTLAAEEAFPISDSVVRIKGASDANREIQYTLFTDEDGITESVELPTPELALSLDPTYEGPVYAEYDVTVIKEGYYTKLLRGVTVFPNTDSVLNVSMLPVVTYSDGGAVPRDNLVSGT